MNDLVLKGGKSSDPSQALTKGTDHRRSRNGKVAAIFGDNLSGQDVRGDVKGKIGLRPASFDLHPTSTGRHVARCRGRAFGPHRPAVPRPSFRCRQRRPGQLPRLFAST